VGREMMRYKYNERVNLKWILQKTIRGISIIVIKCLL